MTTDPPSAPEPEIIAPVWTTATSREGSGATPRTKAGVQAVILDLDGILIDSAPDVHAAINRLLLSMNRRTLTMEEVRPRIGDGVDVLVQHALAATGPAPIPELLPDFMDRFLRLHRAQGGARRGLYPGGREALSALAAREIRLGICTNRPQRAALESLSVHRLGVRNIVGGDAIGARKPDARHLRAMINQLGVSPRQVVLVADGERDILSALRVGVRCVAVSYGYGQYHPSRYGISTIIDQIGQLPDAIDRLEAGNGLTDWEVDWEALGTGVKERLVPVGTAIKDLHQELRRELAKLPVRNRRGR